MVNNADKSQPDNHGSPRKPCTVCSETIIRQRRLAANWDKVLYCSAACRRIAVAEARAAHNDHEEAYGRSAADSTASAA
jgi:hypothetical protein